MVRKAGTFLVSATKSSAKKTSEENFHHPIAHPVSNFCEKNKKPFASDVSIESYKPSTLKNWPNVAQRNLPTKGGTKAHSCFRSRPFLNFYQHFESNLKQGCYFLLIRNFFVNIRTFCQNTFIGWKTARWRDFTEWGALKSTFVVIWCKKNS